jgi:anaerobic magnesium-protoporphyrin IX monomethyl ester cyclase
MRTRCVRFALVRPPVEVLHKFSKPVESLAIAYLAAALRSVGHSAVMLDGMLEDWTDTETARRILQEEPDAIGFTTVLQKFPENLPGIVQQIRASGFRGPVFVGGHAVSFIAREILEAFPEIDGVVRGEGEAAIVSIADALASGEDWRGAPGVAARVAGNIVGQPVRRMRDLGSLDGPARDLTCDVIRRDGLVAVSTSRGCHARCSFCSVPRFYGLESGRKLAAGDWLARDARASAAEIAGLHDYFGVREVLIVDDEFFGGTATGQIRALHFADEMVSLRRPVRFALSCRAEHATPEVLERLAEGGLAHVFIGLESGHDPDLKLYGKGHSARQNAAAVDAVKSLGLSFQPGFMLFNHRSTLSGLREGLRFLEQIGELKPIAINSAVDPHFGVPLTADMRRQNVLVEGALALSSSYNDPAVAALKTVAEATARAFVPVMNFIATTQSAITYEWRRKPPQRAAQTCRVLESFEQNANAAFAAVVLAALDALEAAPSTGADVIVDAHAHIRSVTDEVKIRQALVAEYLSAAEGGVRYFSQADLIAAAASAGATA